VTLQWNVPRHRIFTVDCSWELTYTSIFLFYDFNSYKRQASKISTFTKLVIFDSMWHLSECCRNCIVKKYFEGNLSVFEVRNEFYNLPTQEEELRQPKSRVCCWSDKALHLYWKGAKFESLPEHLVFWRKFYLVSSLPPCKCRESASVRPRPLSSISFFISHPSIRRCTISILKRVVK
jgi:hypothetical protein